MKIYVASSWKNHLQPGIVHTLRRIGHDVYDFRNPAKNNKGFSWSAIDPNWESWTPEEYQKALSHPIAEAGYKLDIDAVRACEACVYVLPCGRSASWELGYIMGQGKPGYVVMFDNETPDLMFKECTFITNMNQIFDIFGEPL